MRKQIENSTVKLFTKIHKAQFAKQIFFRFSNALSTEYLGLNKNFFYDKVCLDAASGLNANATVNMLNLGAKHVHLFDINKNILKVTKNFLIKKFAKSKFTIKKSNLLKIDYPDNYFYFVHCSGSIHHTVDYKKSVKELCRVTKNGGLLYFNYYGKGGIVKEVVDFLRTKYKKDIRFKKFIKRLDKNTFNEIILFIKSQNDKYKINKFSNSEYKNFKKYFDYDSILSIKDMIQAPLYKQIEYKDLIKILKSNGFYKIKRISRFPYYENYRKFLSPFYKNYNNYYSKMLYGDGVPQIISKKK